MKRKKIPRIHDRGMTLVGAWILDGGGKMNEVLTIWQIRGLRERFETRYGKDVETRSSSSSWRWNRLNSMVEKENSVVLKLLHDWELEFPQTNGTYEIQVTRFKPDSGWQRSFSDATRVKDSVLDEYTGKALGIFFPLFGRLNKAYQLWQFKDLDSRNRGLNVLTQNSGFNNALRSILPLIIEEERMLLRPTRCSPMQ